MLKTLAFHYSNKLSTEILINILQHLPLKDIQSLSQAAPHIFKSLNDTYDLTLLLRMLEDPSQTNEQFSQKTLHFLSLSRPDDTPLFKRKLYNLLNAKPKSFQSAFDNCSAIIKKNLTSRFEKMFSNPTQESSELRHISSSIFTRIRELLETNYFLPIFQDGVNSLLENPINYLEIGIWIKNALEDESSFHPTDIDTLAATASSTSENTGQLGAALQFQGLFIKVVNFSTNNLDTDKLSGFQNSLETLLTNDINYFEKHQFRRTVAKILLQILNRLLLVKTDTAKTEIIEMFKQFPMQMDFECIGGANQEAEDALFMLEKQRYVSNLINNAIMKTITDSKFGSLCQNGNKKHLPHLALLLLSGNQSALHQRDTHVISVISEITVYEADIFRSQILNQVKEAIKYDIHDIEGQFKHALLTQQPLTVEEEKQLRTNPALRLFVQKEDLLCNFLDEDSMPIDCPVSEEDISSAIQNTIISIFPQLTEMQHKKEALIQKCAQYLFKNNGNPSIEYKQFTVEINQEHYVFTAPHSRQLFLIITQLKARAPISTEALTQVYNDLAIPATFVDSSKEDASHLDTQTIQSLFSTQDLASPLYNLMQECMLSPSKYPHTDVFHTLHLIWCVTDMQKGESLAILDFFHHHITRNSDENSAQKTLNSWCENQCPAYNKTIAAWYISRIFNRISLLRKRLEESEKIFQKTRHEPETELSFAELQILGLRIIQNGNGFRETPVPHVEEPIEAPIVYSAISSVNTPLNLLNFFLTHSEKLSAEKLLAIDFFRNLHPLTIQVYCESTKLNPHFFFNQILSSVLINIPKNFAKHVLEGMTTLKNLHTEYITFEFLILNTKIPQCRSILVEVLEKCSDAALVELLVSNNFYLSRPEYQGGVPGCYWQLSITFYHY